MSRAERVLVVEPIEPFVEEQVRLVHSDHASSLGAIAILLLEWGNPATLGGHDAAVRPMTAAFMSMMTRSGGFATVGTRGPAHGPTRTVHRARSPARVGHAVEHVDETEHSGGQRGPADDQPPPALRVRAGPHEAHGQQYQQRRQPGRTDPERAT